MLLDIAPSRTSFDARFRADVLTGFAMRPQRAVSARWFYDRRGSELFEEITRLSEYYPARTETALLDEHCREIGALVGPGRAVVEFGSGSSIKTPILLGCIEPAAYVPVDISGEFLRLSAEALAHRFPALPIIALEADFTDRLILPEALQRMPKLGFFPGSTIGNVGAHAATELLRAIRQTLGEGAMLLIGIDRLKDEGPLIRAYDDRRGITAAFNLNLLHRINRELGGDIPVAAFHHLARWNALEARVEMHLEVTRDVTFHIDGYCFSMAAGETVHTENSHKYSLHGARLPLRAGAWTPVRDWTDRDNNFALILASAEPIAMAP